jgi:hypothetical protein
MNWNLENNLSMKNWPQFREKLKKSELKEALKVCSKARREDFNSYIILRIWNRKVDWVKLE